MQEDLAREQVAIFTALTYLEVLRSERALLAAQADADLAQALLVLAQDQRTAGIATGVDVTRAETRLAQQQVRLAQAKTALEEARLQLQRVVGLPLGSQLTLNDPLRFSDETLPAIDSAIAQPEQDRPEVRIAWAQVTLTDYKKRAARAELLLNVEFLTLIRDSDEMRERYFAEMTNHEWTCANNYHLSIDTSLMPLEDIAQTIITIMKRRD